MIFAFFPWFSVIHHTVLRTTWSIFIIIQRYGQSTLTLTNKLNTTPLLHCHDNHAVQHFCAWRSGVPKPIIVCRWFIRKPLQSYFFERGSETAETLVARVSKPDPCVQRAHTDTRSHKQPDMRWHSDVREELFDYKTWLEQDYPRQPKGYRITFCCSRWKASSSHRTIPGMDWLRHSWPLYQSTSPTVKR